jgi:CheY-like chemotaxis protein
VLFVDGNKVNRQYWRQRLYISSPDYLILETDSGAEGLAICQSQRVDCVVTEHNFPDMSGFELLVSRVTTSTERFRKRLLWSDLPPRNLHFALDAPAILVCYLAATRIGQTSPISRHLVELWFVVFCGVRLSEVESHVPK